MERPGPARHSVTVKDIVYYDMAYSTLPSTQHRNVSHQHIDTISRDVPPVSRWSDPLRELH